MALQRTHSSRTRIHYPEKLLLHCTGFPKSHKTEQDAKKHQLFLPNSLPAPVHQQPPLPVPVSPGRGQAPAESIASCPWTSPGEGQLRIPGEEASSTWANKNMKPGCRLEKMGWEGRWGEKKRWRNLQHPAPGYTIPGCSPCPWAPNTSDELRPWPGCCYRAGSLLLSICLYLNWSRVSQKKKYL